MPCLITWHTFLCLNIWPDFQVHWFIHFSGYFRHLERRELNMGLSASRFNPWPWIVGMISDRWKKKLRIGVVSRYCHVTRIYDMTSPWLLFVPVVCDATMGVSLLFMIPETSQYSCSICFIWKSIAYWWNYVWISYTHGTLYISSKMSLCLEIW